MFTNEYGIPTQHEIGAILDIQRIISNFSPELVIELGTKFGGFTCFLKECTSGDVPIYSFDNMVYDENLKSGGRLFIITCDILYGANELISRLCMSDKRKLLYCDNGNKIAEVKAYASLLKEGDLLGVHDWGTEINYGDVEEIISLFTPLEHDVFESNRWKTRFWTRGG